MDRFHIPGVLRSAVFGFNFCMVNGNYKNIIFAFPFGKIAKDQIHDTIFMTFQKTDKIMRD